MDLNDTPEQAAVRAEVKEMNAASLPEAQKTRTGDWMWDRKSDDPAKRGPALEWQQAAADRGWIAPHRP